MNLKYFCALFVFLFTLNIQSQIDSNSVLFTVDNESVYATEFIRVYNKNLDLVQDESQKDVDAYLSLFKSYKLKLKEARDLEFDKKPSYIRELSNYRKQLAKNYLTDNKVTDALVEEAYQRTITEVKASHVLIKIPEDASPKDTLIAYNEIIKIREALLNVGFETIQKDIHDGKKYFVEGLGYFSCFKMVYDFENAAYNTNVGEVSMPFRTRFGYHIVKVFDKRASRGEVTIGNLMVSSKQGDSIQESPEDRINDIYKKLSQGEDFESLAKQFSDDKSSANNGGKMQPFSGGQLSSEIFENAAFDLKNIGDVSQPFKTKFGWHIIKLYEKQETKSFEELKPELEVKVKRDSRSKLINNALLSTLKERYEIDKNESDLVYFESILNDDYFKRIWDLPTGFDGSKRFLKIDTKQLTYQDFGNFLLKSQRKPKTKQPMSKIVSDSYEQFLNSNLVQYQEDNLENENEDFANIVGEYRDGLLLFDLMETKIWNVAQTDTLGLKEFYNANKQNYTWKERVDADVASSANESDIKRVQELLKSGKSTEQIKEALNVNDKVAVIFTSSIMDAQHQALPKGFEFKQGVSKVYSNNDAYLVANVKKVLPSELKTFEEAKGRIISDYQEYKEVKWIEELNTKYNIVVNQKVLDKVKAHINNQ